MTAPVHNEIVIAAGGAEFEVRLSVADGSQTVGEVIARITGEPAAHVELDGFPVSRDASVASLPLVRGSRLALREHPPLEPICALVGLEGAALGEVVGLSPGVRQLGSIDVGVQVSGDQGGAARLYVDVDGAVTIDPVAEVFIGGEVVDTLTPLLFGEELRVGAQLYRLEPVGVPTPGKGRIPFNRPPRSEFPASLPRLVAPGAPPAAQQPMRFGWGALVIPVVIGGIMALIWSPVMAIFAIFSPAMMLANYYEDKRRAKRANSETAAGLSAALADFKNRLNATVIGARCLAWRGNPPPGEIGARLAAGDSRLWQRRHNHPDFLEVALGAGEVPWRPDVTPGEPDRADEANQLIAQLTHLADVPVTVDLGAGRVLGIAGHRRRQIEMARWIVSQAAAHHGPADLSIAVITDHPDEWDWLKWLPHLQIDGDAARLAVASPGESADELLAPLLDPGDSDSPAGLRERPAGPAVLLLVDIDDVTSAPAAPVRRVLAGEGGSRRCAVALARTVEELPSSCSDIAQVDPAGVAILDCPSRAQRIGPFPSWRMAAPAARRVARMIGRYADPDQRSATSSVADVVHLLDLIGMGERTSDAVVRRWLASGPTPRCAAPIGATAEGPLVVDWVGDGPHGLLAGTTGSGKSELLRSLVASLAATVDPEHLNFVLVDYKGGSAFDACAGLPHTVGMVTDLDGHLAQRALTCLEAELRYREELLRGVGASDIDEYQAASQPEPGEPLPRLLVVIDEFAALAKELPDFMAALVDVAQRGRSLGVHMLLATQRPNGVINDNIRANTNLRLSLRVQDIADSMDVIGAPEAAALSRSRPGRGYLRRGPGDVVAFQSALVTGQSGAAASAVGVAPFRLVPEPSDRAPLIADAPDSKSDLEVLVAMVQEAATKAQMRPSRLPWPDPLPECIDAGELRERYPMTPAPGQVVIGIADEPHRQRQRPFSWAAHSNLLIYGVQGSGTSAALRTVVTATCREESPHDLHVYVLDFDDQTLSPLERLPHVGAVIGAGERDRQVRLLRYLQREVARRREVAATDPVALAGMARILLGVDNFAGFRAAFDEPADMAVKESLGRLVADGPGVGIVVVATAKQPIDIPTQVAALVPAKLVMRLADRYEYTGLGVSGGEPPEIPGRAFESGSSLEVQLAAVGTNDIEELAAAVPRPAVDKAPWAIELLPAEVKIPDVAGEAAIYDLEWRVPVAIGDDLLAPVGWSLREGDNVLIAGPARSGKSTALATIATVLKAARPDIRITALTPRRSALRECADIDLFVADPEQLRGSLAMIAAGRPHAIVIDDAEDIEDTSGIVAALIADRQPHRHIFAAGAADVLRSAYGHWTQGVRRSRLGLALNPNVGSDGDLWQTTLPRHGPSFYPPGRGYLVAEGRVELAQVAWQ